MREDDDRIGRAEIAPGVATRAAHDNLEAATAQRFGDDRVGAGSIQNQAAGDRIIPAWIGENVTHPTQIAFAFFADVSNEQNRQQMFHSPARSKLRLPRVKL